MSDDRKGDWMQTFTGGQFWVEDPRVGDFKIRDIAHHLATTNRFNGAALEPISVAQHCVIVSTITVCHSLEGLMHDAYEAYLGDLIRPAKNFGLLGDEYRRLEALGEGVLAEQFGLEWPWPECVKSADNICLATEKRDRMAYCDAPWQELPAPLPGRFSLKALPWELAETMFLERFEILGGYERAKSC